MPPDGGAVRLNKRARHLLEELAGASSISTHQDRSAYLKLVAARLAEETGHYDLEVFPVIRMWQYEITPAGLVELVGAPYVCSGCSTGAEWIGKPLALKVERVDGKCTRFLCPNCYVTRD